LRLEEGVTETAMSLFQNVTLACPGCSTPVAFELVASVNADRRADLREAILDGSFQRETCPSCDTVFRAEPQFSYIELGRRLYIVVWPLALRSDWPARVAQSEQAFALAYGKEAGPEAQELAAGVALRTVFGWPALREKLIAVQAGVDDATLELAKLSVLRRLVRAPLPGRLELRLIGRHDEMLQMAWVDAHSGRAEQALEVEATLIAQIEADAPAWQALRDELLSSPLVDFQRDLLGR
jgi:hypothetical protein